MNLNPKQERLGKISFFNFSLDIQNLSPIQERLGKILFCNFGLAIQNRNPNQARHFTLHLLFRSKEFKFQARTAWQNTHRQFQFGF